MNFVWKIEGVKAIDGLITQAKYHCRAEKIDLWVATEGTWFFADPQLQVPYSEVTEQMVIGWIDKDLIERRLAEQIASLEADVAETLPWAPQTFTPQI